MNVKLTLFTYMYGVNTKQSGLPNVTVHHITQHIDHFGYDASLGSYQQRYFKYEQYLQDPSSPPSIVFFYCGNEDNVELYVNNTGLSLFLSLALIYPLPLT